MGRFSEIRDWRFSLATKLERKEKLKEEPRGQGDKLDGDSVPRWGLLNPLMVYLPYFFTQTSPILVQIYYNIDSVHKA